jgi:outer membrane lipoprotein SlyB
MGMWRKQKWLSALSLMLAYMMLFGCASKYGEQITTVKYYSECYQPIQHLRDAEKEFNNKVAGSIVAGVLLGAVAGALTGKPQYIIAGALAGGVVAGAAGYAKAKRDQIKDDTQRMASYLKDLDGDISGLNAVTAAASVARQCYDKQFDKAVEDFKAGRMTRAELNERHQEIRSGGVEASTILGTVVDSATKKELAYQQALQEEAGQFNRSVPDPVMSQAAKEAEAAAASAAAEAAAAAVAESEALAKKKSRVSKKAKVKKPDEEPALEIAAETKKPAPSKPASSKYEATTTGDGLVDMSTRNAKYTESISNAKAEQQRIQESEAKRKKLLEQLTG